MMYQFRTYCTNDKINTGGIIFAIIDNSSSKLSQISVYLGNMV